MLLHICTWAGHQGWWSGLCGAMGSPHSEQGLDAAVSTIGRAALKPCVRIVQQLAVALGNPVGSTLRRERDHTPQEEKLDHGRLDEARRHRSSRPSFGRHHYPRSARCSSVSCEETEEPFRARLHWHRQMRLMQESLLE